MTREGGQLSGFDLVRDAILNVVLKGLISVSYESHFKDPGFCRTSQMVFNASVKPQKL